MAVKKRIRVEKSESAFVYFILESYEGVMAYSTLPHVEGALYRDLELLIPVGQLIEADEILTSLADLVVPISIRQSRIE